MSHSRSRTSRFDIQPDTTWRGQQPLPTPSGMLALPVLWCPFTARLNPFTHEAYGGTLVWVERWKLGHNGAQRQSLAQVAQLAGYFHPTVSRDMLQLIADWYAWFFYQDDLFDQPTIRASPRHMLRLQDIWRATLSGADDQPDVAGLTKPLESLCQRWQAAGSQLWLNRLEHAVSTYFQATQWEASNRQHRRVPSLEAYMRFRPLSGGMGVEQVITSLVDGLELSPDLARHPVVRQATMHADYAVCWTNDFFSLAKELWSGDVHNLVPVVQHQYQISLQAAVTHAVAMYEASIRVLARCQPQSAALRDAHQLQRYLEHMRLRVAGHLVWGAHAYRYQTASPPTARS